MKRLSALLGLATVLAASTAFGGVTFTTRDDATNSLGNPVSASAQFTIVPDGILVTINNTTSDIRHYSQSLQGITFTIYGRRAQGTINYSQARTRTITPDGMQSSPQAEDANWQLSTTGMTYTLRAPGRQRHILPQTNDLVYNKGDKTLKDAPESNPFLIGPVTLHILNKDIGLSDDIIGVKFSWGDELGGFDAKLTADASHGDINTAAGGPGGGGGGGGMAGTPGDISLAPAPPNESFEIGGEGWSGSVGGSGGGGGYGIPDGGDVGGGGGSSSPNRQQQQLGNPNNPNNPLGPIQPVFPDGTPRLSAPPGTKGPNPKPPTSVATIPPPDTRISIPTNHTDPNPTPPTAVASDLPAGDPPPDIRVSLPPNDNGPNPPPPTAVASSDPLPPDPTVTPPVDPTVDSTLDPGSNPLTDSLPDLSAPLALSAAPANVPEPASLALLTLGAAALLTRRRK